MLGTIISAVLGGSGGFLGGELVQSLLGSSAGGLDGIAGGLGGMLGGGVIGNLMGRGTGAKVTGDQAAHGEVKLMQIIGALGGGAGAGAIVQTVIGAIL